LGAGSVSHAVHSFDMKKDMGGLREHMPITFWTFIIGTLALCGIFPLAGFWSKDGILLGAHANGYNFFMVVGMIGAFMTAAYMTRCVYLTFFGEYRGHSEHLHESPKVITGPLIALAGLSVFAGLLNAPHVERFTQWFEPATVAALITHPEFNIGLAIISTLMALAGIGISWAYQKRYALNPWGITQRNRVVHAKYKFLVNKYYLDRLYTDVIVGFIKNPLAKATYWTNQNIIDGVVNGLAWCARQIGRFTYGVIDQKIVDGLVNGAGYSADESGGILRGLQSGRLQQYAVLLFGASAVIGLVIALVN